MEKETLTQEVFRNYNAQNMAEHVVSTLEQDGDTNALVNGFEEAAGGKKDIREELGTNQVKVKSRGRTVQQIHFIANRLRHVRGIEAALKKGGIGNNSKCPCQSGKKFKKCCAPLIRDETIDIDWIAAKLGLHERDAVAANQIADAMKVIS